MATDDKIWVILIDPVARLITRHHIVPVHEEYQRLMLCDCLESYIRIPKGHDESVFMLLDEMGGYKDQAGFYFLTAGYQWLSGRVLVLGQPTREGDDTSCKLTVEQVAEFISFETPVERHHRERRNERKTDRVPRTGK